MKAIKIGNKTLSIPIIQGGMGIGVSLGNLAGSVMNQGGMGVISAANPGFKRKDFYKNNLVANLEQLAIEINKAKTIAKNKGILAVNVMVAGNDYVPLIKQAVKSKVDAIISGAGLPLNLPSITKGYRVAIAPIVSSAKAASLICRVWEKKYGVVPDFIVIEGPDAGGHLGFTKQSLVEKTHQNLATILAEVKKVVIPFQQRFQRKIPIFVAGGIFTGQDIAQYVKAGADGVQMGTRFIGTHECDAPESFKQVYLNATKEEITLVGSPVGMPGRAINNQFAKVIADRRVPVKRCTDCLIPCNPKNTPYCISQALVNAVSHNNDEGLFFTGVNGHRINKLVSVKALIEELMQEFIEAMEG